MSSNFLSILQKAQQEEILLHLSLELTYGCELHCPFCYIEDKKRKGSLTLGQYMDILQEAKRMHCLFLLLTGGEPTHHPHFFTIAEAALERGFVLRIKTHAAYDDLNRVQRICALKFVAIDVSIHGAHPETHDRITGQKGSFHQVLKNVSSFTQSGLNVSLKCPITTENIHERSQIKRLAESLGCSIQFDHTITPKHDGDTSPTRFRCAEAIIYDHLEREKAESPSMREESLQRGKVSESGQQHSGHESYYYCGGGTNNLAIDPDGRVFPCVGWKHSIGKFPDQSLSHLWHHSKAIQEARAKNHRFCVHALKHGDKKKVFFTCPGNVELGG